VEYYVAESTIIEEQILAEPFDWIVADGLVFLGVVAGVI
jgi:hypothetical protein